jgi:hypothetical protein
MSRIALTSQPHFPRTLESSRGDSRRRAERRVSRATIIGCDRRTRAFAGGLRLVEPRVGLSLGERWWCVSGSPDVR